MTAGFTGTDMAAGDAAWRAWNRLGVNAWDHMLVGAPGPAILEALDAAMAPELDRVTRLVLDELEVRLYGEARERVVAAVRGGMVHHALWAVVDAVRVELTRPDPVPFTPPPAGSWVRARWAARPAGRRLPERPPTWNGRWHLFSGDIRSTRRVNVTIGVSRCGLRIRLRDDDIAADAAIAESQPGVDACRRCARAR